jgi:hypothetical protein
MNAKTWLIGEFNPYGQDPKYALYPHPENASGARLARVLEMAPDAYLAAFERRNLLSQAKWSAPLARESARKLVEETSEGDSLVLLGARVSAAFGIDFRAHLFAVKEAGRTFGGTWRRATLVIPHPSGLSREWSAPGTAQRVRDAFRRLSELRGVEEPDRVGGDGIVGGQVPQLGEESAQEPPSATATRRGRGRCRSRR